MTWELDPEVPYVCPGCHAVGGERCAPGCIDAEIEAEHREAIETGDYERFDEDDDCIADDCTECDCSRCVDEQVQWERAQGWESDRVTVALERARFPLQEAVAALEAARARKVKT